MHFLSKANNEQNSHFLRSSRTAHLLSVHTWEAIWTPAQQRTSWKCRYAGLLVVTANQDEAEMSDALHRSWSTGASRGWVWFFQLDFSMSSVTLPYPLWPSPRCKSTLQISLLVSLMGFGNDLNSFTCWFTELCLCSPLPSSAVTGAPSMCVTQANSSTSVSHPTPPHLLGPSVHNSPLSCAAKPTL